MKSAILILSALAVLVNIFLFKDNGSALSAEAIGIPTRSIFENEIIKPIYDSEILVHAIEQKLMH
jgi:hypothetical protein